MTPGFSIFISILSVIVLSESTFAVVDPKFETCSVSKSCGDNQTIKYPFYITNQQEPFCGYHGFMLKCNPDGRPILELSGRDYLVNHISYGTQTLTISDAAISTTSTTCLPLIKNLSLPSDKFQLVQSQKEIYLIYNCSRSNLQFDRRLEYESVCLGNDTVVAVKSGGGLNLVNVMERCGKESVVVAAPVEDPGELGGVVGALRSGFVLEWTAGDCKICAESGGVCGFDDGSFHFKCYCPDRPHAWRCASEERIDTTVSKLKIALGVGVPGVLLLILLFSVWYYRKRCSALNVLKRNISCRPSSKSDLEDGNVFFEVPVFSYDELEKATNKFDRDKELGDGGFGTVYHGKLHDGREVAVKRLYQQNYRRVEQFINEVKILTRLRHKNLVSLYGCTSRHSRELLLVYEFIPNGTVADHLHGEQANCSSLTWPIRMNIAIETASALVYLHASDIIHRDVKTTNILLDSNFSVKVADFGLSRLFPNDVSHVSTAPQGTPGYVDPEYYQCYHLTTKSDVYSFGVVLIELITSMPAVDITRHRHEINLSNLAVNKILKQEVDELIDPCLGFQSDDNVREMIMAVAWLAFHCLQQDKERRPTMEEALETLRKIQSGEEEKMDLENSTIILKSYEPAPSPEFDEVELLKNKRHQLSPTSVADKWISSTSFNASASSSISSIS